MPFRQQRMIEVVVGIVRHAQLFHHSPGAGIFRHCEGNHLHQPEFPERKAQDLPRGLRGQSLPPKLARQPPANFNGGHERSIEARNRETDEAQKYPIVTELGREQTEAVLLEVNMDAVNQPIRLFLAEQGGMNSITCRSALIRANGFRSESRQGRRRILSVMRVAFIPRRLSPPGASGPVTTLQNGVTFVALPSP